MNDNADITMGDAPKHESSPNSLNPEISEGLPNMVASKSSFCKGEESCNSMSNATTAVDGSLSSSSLHTTHHKETSLDEGSEILTEVSFDAQSSESIPDIPASILLPLAEDVLDSDKNQNINHDESSSPVPTDPSHTNKYIIVNETSSPTMEKSLIDIQTSLATVSSSESTHDALEKIEKSDLYVDKDVVSRKILVYTPVIQKHGQGPPTIESFESMVNSESSKAIFSQVSNTSSNSTSIAGSEEYNPNSETMTHVLNMNSSDNPAKSIHTLAPAKTLSRNLKVPGLRLDDHSLWPVIDSQSSILMANYASTPKDKAPVPEDEATMFISDDENHAGEENSIPAVPSPHIPRACKRPYVESPGSDDGTIIKKEPVSRSFNPPNYQNPDIIDLKCSDDDEEYKNDTDYEKSLFLPKDEEVDRNADFHVQDEQPMKRNSPPPQSHLKGTKRDYIELTNTDYGDEGVKEESPDSYSSDDDYSGSCHEEDDSKIFPENSQHRIQQKSKKPRIVSKTAREYFSQHPNSWSLAKKSAEIEKIPQKLHNRSRKKQRKSPTGNGNFLDPRQFLQEGTKQSDSEDFKPPEKGVSDVFATTKVEFLKKIAARVAQNPELGFHKTFETDGRKLYKKSQAFGLGRMKKSGNGWKLAEMPTTLRNHQLIGTHFIVGRECAEDGPFGSICADEMGLGKTVQAIAAMVANPPAEDHLKINQKTTLIVVPSSLRSQWFEELNKHAPYLGETTMIYQASDKDNSVARLNLHNVVLTTYWELHNSLPHPTKSQLKEWLDDKDADFFEELERWTVAHMDRFGFLHQVDWYRIILDEGHFIKNPYSGTSWSALKLKGQHRLLLSGTPIMNHYYEFYPLLRFLNEPLTANQTFEEFRVKYCDQEDLICIQRLGLLLSDLVIRRDMTDKLMSEIIVELPTSHKKCWEIQPDPAEALIDHEITVRLGEIAAAQYPPGHPLAKLKPLYAQLTRLRQLAASVELIGLQVMIMFQVDELRRLQQAIKDLKVKGQPKSFANVLFKRFDMWIQEKKDNTYKSYLTAGIEEAECDCCTEVGDDFLFFKKCRHNVCGLCVDETLTLELLNEDLEDGVACPKCKTTCLTKDIKKPKESRSFRRKPAKRGKDFKGFRPSFGPGQNYVQSLLDRHDEGQLNFLPSSKLVGIVEQVKQWVSESRDDKIIVFTQFRPFSVMIGSLLEKEKVDFLYFSGDMSHKQRSNTVNVFKTERKARVMITGLKCGGLGLNFNFANRVVIADPWWNSCVDNQAFGRVYRIGQEKETHLARVFIQHTIDTRILQTQKKKAKAIGAIMQDKLSDEDWKFLLRGKSDKKKSILKSIISDEIDEGNFEHHLIGV